MNRRDFSKTLLMGGSSLLLTGRATVFLPPMTSIAFAFDAVNPGKAWVFRWRHLYHMATGMMTTVSYEGG